MEDNTNIFGRRLNQARRMRGLSMESLARSLHPAVSRQAIYKYEKGFMKPDSRMLIALCSVLSVKPDFLFRPFTVEVEKVMFRKKAGFSEKEVLAVKEKVREELERYLEIEQLCGSRLTFTLSKMNVSDDEEAMFFARKIRTELGLGMDGISNVVEVLEDNGVKIIEVPEKEAFEGLSGYANKDIPLVVINSGLNSERKRFTLLHELGHLLMTFDNETPERKIEGMCNVFACELLLPSKVLIARLGDVRHGISLEELTDIQIQFGIAIDAIMFGLRHNDVISERRYEGYKKKKLAFPDFQTLVEKSRVIPETSRRFVRMVYRALADEAISFGKAAALLNTSVEVVKNNLQLV